MNPASGMPNPINRVAVRSKKNVATGFGLSTDDLGRGFYAWEGRAKA
jgi:hypothetical protein